MFEKGLRDMLKRQFVCFFVIFLLKSAWEEEEEEKQKAIVEGVKEGGGDGFVQPVKGFQKQAQPTTMSPSLA